MPKYVDLSLTVGPELVPLTGHPPVVFEAIDTHARNGKSNTKVSFSIHSAGTHVDAPFHFFRDGKTIDQVPVNWLIRPGVKLDVRDVAKTLEPITVDHLKAAALDLGMPLAEKIVLLYSGWIDTMLGKPGYWGRNPYLSAKAAEWLVSERARAVGLDFPPGRGAGSSAGMTGEDGSAQIHRIFLGHEVLQIENVTNLGLLPPTGFTVIALPIKFEGCDGGPARVVAAID